MINQSIKGTEALNFCERACSLVIFATMCCTQRLVGGFPQGNANFEMLMRIL